MNDRGRAPDGAAILAEMAHWQGILGQAEMLAMEHGAAALLTLGDEARALIAARIRADADASPAAPWAATIAMWRELSAAGVPGAAAPQATLLAGLIRRLRLLLAAELGRRLDRSAGQDHAALATLVDALAAEDPDLPPSPRETAAVARALATRGQSLLAGLDHVLADLGSGALQPAPPIAPRGTLALETDRLRLFVTDRADRETLLVFPSPSAPVTALDLPEPFGFLGWTQTRGIALATVQWIAGEAPGASDRLPAMAAALDHVAETGRPVHLLGEGDAGVLLAMLLAREAAGGQAARIASATLIGARIDFAVPAPGAGLSHAAVLTEAMRGYILGALVDPADPLPAVALRRALVAKGGSHDATGSVEAVGEVEAALGRIITPCYLLAGQEDRAAPPAALWPLADRIAAPARLVLAEGDAVGAITGSAGFRCSADGTPPDPEADALPGSWWPDWLAWLNDAGRDDGAFGR